MRELKARMLGQTINEYGCDTKIYLKSEADKVIDFWKNASHDHYERWFNLNKQYEGWFGKVMRCERAERELRHQKYKRCLAMADYCYTNVHCIMGHRLCALADFKRDWFERWHKRWLELAEKFKEGI